MEEPGGGDLPPPGGREGDGPAQLLAQGPPALLQVELVEPVESVELVEPVAVHGKGSPIGDQSRK